MAGGGPLLATITYTTGGIPIPPHACVPSSSFTLSGGSPAGVVVQLVNDEYVGPITVSGSGTTPCADSALEFGTMPAGSPVTIVGNSPVTGSSLACNDIARPLTGQYLRIGVHLHIALQGACSVNGSTPSFAIVAAEGELVPVPGTVPAPGAVVPQWQFAGAFALDVL